MHLYGPPAIGIHLTSNSHSTSMDQVYPCMKFTCPGRIIKLMYVASVTHGGSNQPMAWPEFSLWRNDSTEDCEYGWFKVQTLKMANPEPTLVHVNGTVGVYEMMFTTNNSFESDDVLGLYLNASTVPSSTLVPLYQRGGGYCDILYPVMTSDNVYRAFTGDPIIPYVAIETGQPCMLL